jgi:hypothetical protein
MWVLTTEALVSLDDDRRHPLPFVAHNVEWTVHQGQPVIWQPGVRLLQFDGERWMNHGLKPADVALSGGSLWALQDSTVLEWNGDWVPHPLPAPGPTLLVDLGESRPAVIDRDTLWRWDGTDWGATPIPEKTTDAVLVDGHALTVSLKTADFAGFDVEYGFGRTLAAGHDGLAEWNGERWIRLGPGPAGASRCITSSSGTWVFGAHAEAWLWTEGVWSQWPLDLQYASAARDVDRYADRVVVVVDHTASTFDGQTWQPWHAGDRLNAVSVHRDGAAVVGAHGLLARFDGGGWKKTATGTEVSLNDVWTDGEQIWAVGGEGLLLHASGDRVSTETVIVPIRSGDYAPRLTAVDGFGDLVVAVGDLGVLFTWDDGEWTRHGKQRAAFRAVDVFSESFAVAVGARGMVVVWDGSTWTSIEAPNVIYAAIEIRSPSDVLVSSRAGEGLHFDGTAWTEVDLHGHTTDICTTRDGHRLLAGSAVRIEQ